MYFLIALSCEVKHALRKESLLKKLPIAHQFEADLVFIPSDKVSSLPGAVRQFLYHMVYCTARPNCSCWVHYFDSFPGKINCFVTIFILTSSQLPTSSNYSPLLQCFHGSELFVPTLCEVLLCHCWCKQLVSFYNRWIIICSYCAICNVIHLIAFSPAISRDLPITQPTQTFN